MLHISLFDGPRVFSGGRYIHIPEQQSVLLSIVSTYMFLPVTRDMLTDLIWRHGTRPALLHRVSQIIHSINRLCGGQVIVSSGPKILTVDSRLLISDVATPLALRETMRGISDEDFRERFLSIHSNFGNDDFAAWRSKIIRLILAQSNDASTRTQAVVSQPRDRIVRETATKPKEDSLGLNRAPLGSPTHPWARDRLMETLVTFFDDGHPGSINHVRLHGKRGIGKTEVMKALRLRARETGAPTRWLEVPVPKEDENAFILEVIQGISSLADYGKSRAEAEKDSGERRLVGKELSGQGYDPDALRQRDPEDVKHGTQCSQAILFFDVNSHRPDARIKNLLLALASLTPDLRLTAFESFLSPDVERSQIAATSYCQTGDSEAPEVFLHDIVVDELNPADSELLAKELLKESRFPHLTPAVIQIGGGNPRRIRWFANQIVSGSTNVNVDDSEFGISLTEHIISELGVKHHDFLMWTSISKFGAPVDFLMKKHGPSIHKTICFDLERTGWVSNNFGFIEIVDADIRKSITSTTPPSILSSMRSDFLRWHNKIQKPGLHWFAAEISIEQEDFDSGIDWAIRSIMENKFTPWSREAQTISSILDKPLSDIYKLRTIEHFTDSWVNGAETPTDSELIKRLIALSHVTGSSERTRRRMRAMATCAELSRGLLKANQFEQTIKRELHEACDVADYRCFERYAMEFLRNTQNYIASDNIWEILQIAEEAADKIVNQYTHPDGVCLYIILCSDIHIETNERNARALDALMANPRLKEDPRLHTTILFWKFLSFYHECELNTAVGTEIRSDIFGILSEIGFVDQKVNYFINSAVWYKDTGDIEAARISIDQANSLLTPFAPPWVRQRFLYNHGEVLLLEGEFKAAHQCFQKAADLQEGAGSTAGAVLIASGIQRAAYNMGKRFTYQPEIPEIERLSGRWAVDLSSAWDIHRRRAVGLTARLHWIHSAEALLRGPYVRSRIWRAKFTDLAIRAAQSWNMDPTRFYASQLALELDQRGLSSLARRVAGPPR